MNACWKKMGLVWGTRPPRGSRAWCRSIARGDPADVNHRRHRPLNVATSSSRCFQGSNVTIRTCHNATLCLKCDRRRAPRRIIASRTTRRCRSSPARSPSATSRCDLARTARTRWCARLARSPSKARTQWCARARARPYAPASGQQISCLILSNFVKNCSNHFLQGVQVFFFSGLPRLNMNTM